MMHAKRGPTLPSAGRVSARPPWKLDKCLKSWSFKSDRPSTGRIQNRDVCFNWHFVIFNVVENLWRGQYASDCCCTLSKVSSRFCLRSRVERTCIESKLHKHLLKCLIKRTWLLWWSSWRKLNLDTTANKHTFYACMHALKIHTARRKTEWSSSTHFNNISFK